jgi:hypothetical protein
MMQLHKGYWISGTAVPGPPYTTYWEILGTILKPHRGGSIVEVARLRLPAVTAFDWGRCFMNNAPHYVVSLSR